MGNIRLWEHVARLCGNERLRQCCGLKATAEVQPSTGVNLVEQEALRELLVHGNGDDTQVPAMHPLP